MRVLARVAQLQRLPLDDVSSGDMRALGLRRTAAALTLALTLALSLTPTLSKQVNVTTTFKYDMPTCMRSAARSEGVKKRRLQLVQAAAAGRLWRRRNRRGAVRISTRLESPHTHTYCATHTAMPSMNEPLQCTFWIFLLFANCCGVATLFWTTSGVPDNGCCCTCCVPQG
jgi:hypothetical protein